MAAFALNPNKFETKWRLRDIIIIIVAGNLFSSLLALTITPEHPILFNHLIHAFMVVIIMAYSKYELKMPWGSFGFNLDHAIRYAAYGFLLSLLQVFVSAAISQDFLVMYKTASDATLLDHLALVKAVMLYHPQFHLILLPFSEEVLSKAVLYCWLRQHSGVWPSVVISSTIFSALHYMEVSHLHQYISLLFLSVLSALAYEKYRSLLLITVAHSFYNFIVNYFSILSNYLAG